MLEVKDLVKTFGNYSCRSCLFPNPRWKNHGANWPKRAGKTTTFRLILDF